MNLQNEAVSTEALGIPSERNWFSKTHEYFIESNVLESNLPCVYVNSTRGK